MFDESGGTDFQLQQLRGELIAALQAPIESRIEGITLLGGEPLAQPHAAIELARTARMLGLSVMIFTGWKLDELRQGAVPELDLPDLLQNTDLLVDGRFDSSRPERLRRWIGSANQQVHFLSNRYSPTDEFWSEPNTLELRWNDGHLQINGFPVKDIMMSRGNNAENRHGPPGS